MQSPQSSMEINSIKKFLTLLSFVLLPLFALHFYDQLRRNSVVTFEAICDSDVHPSLERDLEGFVVDEITARHIWKQLSPQEREAVFLWAVEGLSANEIALQLGEPREQSSPGCTGFSYD